MRVLIILAATAVAATMAAALTLPAGADERADPDGAKFVACLRAEGAEIPTDARGEAIKAWLLGHPGDERAVAACKPRSGPAPQELVACLRGQGVEPPAAVAELKPWLGRLIESGESKDALKACDVVPKEEKRVVVARGECAGATRPAEDAAKDR
jgi:hypothetical protein